MTIAFRALAAGGALATALLSHAQADAVSNFYKGKTVTIVIGNEVGTGAFRMTTGSPAGDRTTTS